MFVSLSTDVSLSHVAKLKSVAENAPVICCATRMVTPANPVLVLVVQPFVPEIVLGPFEDTIATGETENVDQFARHLLIC